MKLKVRVRLITIMLLFSVFTVTAQQNVLVQNGTSRYQIVLPAQPTNFEQRAADELNKYISQSTKANLAVVKESDAKNNYQLLIGNTKAARTAQITRGVKNDGFAIICKGSKIFISGNQGKGTLYGANAFLEKFLGIDYLSATVITVPSFSNVSIPQNTNIVSNPAFITRDNFTDMGYNGKWNGNEKEYVGGYKDWHSINHVFLDWDKESSWGTFGHTFFKLVPPQTYFSTHPEYYSLVNGKRQPQQLNLSNSNVTDIVIQELKKQMQANPSQMYLMVGQEDMGKFCECADCQKAYQKYGGKASGLMVEFINKVAKNFPDKQIATFAYNETEAPPQNIKPDANVIIVSAPIHAHHNAPLNSTENSQWSNYLKQWGMLTHNQMIWDYYADFIDILSPYPNLAIMSPNFKFYQSIGVKHVFAQRPVFMPGSEMEELKAYVLSKLLWNPTLNQDSLVNSFAQKYYGDAGKYIVQYLTALNTNMKKTKAVLLTQQDASDFSKTFLSSTYIQQYNQIFDNAESAVKSNTELLNRVDNARFALDYFVIKMTKNEGQSSLSKLSQPAKDELKQRFKNSVKRMNIKFTADASQKPIDQYLNVFSSDGFLNKTATVAALFSGIGIAFITRKKLKKKSW